MTINQSLFAKKLFHLDKITFGFRVDLFLAVSQYQLSTKSESDTLNKLLLDKQKTF